MGRVRVPDLQPAHHRVARPLDVAGAEGAGPVLRVEAAARNRQLTGVLEQYQVPYGAVVVLEPSTGRVLAMAEHSRAQPGLRGLATRAVFPAASVFKLVTGSALAREGPSAPQEEKPAEEESSDDEAPAEDVAGSPAPHAPAAKRRSSARPLLSPGSDCPQVGSSVTFTRMGLHPCDGRPLHVSWTQWTSAGSSPNFARPCGVSARWGGK
ncbi:penicillin-binding transpeptidase domain-containing protein [Archangium sp.]|uniref:penicillin-binding transpeptidase domain-containing protein n=1 Tax=Archangium sp. TaxID=1872627 RepID=UPI0039C8B335